MKILITGATGFIGRRIALELLRANHDVVVLSRDVGSARRRLGLPCEYHSWNADSEPAPQKALNGVDTIVHLAGEPVAARRWTRAQKKKIRDSRVLGTRNLLQAIEQRNISERPRALISASAIGYYGDRGDETLAETSGPGKGFLADVCQAWEREALKSESLGLRTAIVRIGVVLGADGGALEKLIPVFRSGIGGPVGSGKQWMSWIHVDDFVSLFVRAATDTTYSGVFNGVAPDPATNADFSKSLARALGRPAALRAPGIALRLAMGEMAAVVLASQRVIPERALRLGFRFEHSHLDEALSQICDPSVRAGDQVFHATQWVPSSPDALWPYFSEARNLETLTPPWLKFKVLGMSTPEIADRTLIDYRLRIKGVPVRWQSRIEEWAPQRKFVDTQTRGPYAKWHHTHEFEPLKNGTLMTDHVLYRVPAGGVGQAVLGSRIRGDIERIFGFRVKKIEELFGEAHIAS